MTVTVSEHYVPSCPECCEEIEKITRAAIRDITVAKLTFIPGHRHNHETAESKSLAPQPSAAALEAAGQQVLPGTTVPVQPNGFDAEVTK